MVEEPQEMVGDRESREHEHRAAESHPPNVLDPGPCEGGFTATQAAWALISAGSGAFSAASSRRKDGRLAGAIPFASFDVMSVGTPL